MRTTTTRLRTLGLAAASVAVLVVLTACQPIRYDGNTGTTTSHAEWRVAAVTTSAGPGIEVRMRSCSTVVLSESSLEEDIEARLRPVAHVTDAEGTVVFSNASPISAVQPAGSKVHDSASTGGDLHRIIVPTSAAVGAITVAPSCTSYPGYGMGPAYTFTFTPCTTTTRSCATRTAGIGTFRG
jgi:hypothetical protein